MECLVLAGHYQQESWGDHQNLGEVHPFGFSFLLFLTCWTEFIKLFKFYNCKRHANMVNRFMLINNQMNIFLKNIQIIINCFIVLFYLTKIKWNLKWEGGKLHHPLIWRLCSPHSPHIGLPITVLNGYPPIPVLNGYPGNLRCFFTILLDPGIKKKYKLFIKCYQYTSLSQDSLYAYS